MRGSFGHGIRIPLGLVLFLAALPQMAQDSKRTPELVPDWGAAVEVPGSGGTERAGEPLPRDPWDDRALRSELLRFIQAPGWRGAEWGVLAVSLERGDTLFQLNAQKPLAPASNQKLFTTAVALREMGADFRFPTFLLAHGDLREGVLHGDLILYGTGDPTLSGGMGADAPAGAFEHFLRVLHERGIREIRGTIVGDGTFFAGDPRRPSWNPEDLNDWFAAPVSALTFNENMATLQIAPGIEPGAPPSVLVQPAGARLPIVNLARTTDRAPSPGLLLVRDHPDDPIELRGEVRMGGPQVWRNLTVSDPPSFAASYFREVLLRGGIQVTGPARAAAPLGESETLVTGRGLSAPRIPSQSAPRTLAVHHSPPLTEILSVVNKRSHNLYSEVLLFTLGHLQSEDASFVGGARALTDYLVREVGISAADLHVEDGSGLSRLNRTSPSGLVRLLEYMDGTPDAQAFWASLPEAGNRRELRRMAQTPAASNLRAKTGTIHRTSALSGMVRTSSGEPILFSIMANNVPSPGAAKRIEDQIGVRLAGFVRARGAPEEEIFLAPGRRVQGSEQ